MYLQVKQVHLELTERCNAACPMCGRNQNGGADNPRLINAELRLADIQTLLPPSFLKDIHKVLLCGNYGDPMVAHDLLPIVRHLRDASDCTISINTNGSIRNPAWWSELGRLLDRPGDNIKFGIDGLADTNPIYRRYTNFDHIIRNAQGFIAAGGTAEWEYIVFRHNEHQIETARAMAADLGFEVFRLKRTGRFYDNKLHRVLEQFPVKDRDGTVAYILEPPTHAQYQNSAIAHHHQALIEKYGSFDDYLDETEIACKVVAESSVYISARGLVFPCCWTGQVYSKSNQDVMQLLTTSDSINGLMTPILDIVRGDLFQRIAEGWSTTRAGGRLGICARICGRQFDQFGAT